MLTVEEASQRIRDALPDPVTEEVALPAAEGRYLAAATPARRILPPWDNSAMDGFAVRRGELPGELPVAGVIAAGDPPARALAAGTVLRIMTGAPMPTGADAVVMREDVDDRGDTAVFREQPPAGDNVRRAGEDIALTDDLVAPGQRLGPGEIGLLAAQGYARVTVARRARVVILSTGDELVDVGTEPAPGQIVNSNAYALAAQVREAGAQVVRADIVADDRAATVAAVRAALADADAVISSGGVSVGDFDYVKEAFDDAGVAMNFWKVAMKPGKPLAFGTSAAGVPVFGLPGNPVSSMIGFELFARPALLAMQGARDCHRRRLPVVMARAYRKSPGRAHVVRAVLERDGDTLAARPHPKQGSGMLSSMVGVDALVLIPAERGDVAAGERLEAMIL